MKYNDFIIEATILAALILIYDGLRGLIGAAWAGLIIGLFLLLSVAALIQKSK